MYILQNVLKNIVYVLQKVKRLQCCLQAKVNLAS